MVATCAAPEEIAVARCTEPLGAINGSSAAVAGLSNAPAMPITKVAMNICGTVSQPAKVPRPETAPSPFHDLANLHHALALEPVRRVAGDEKQQRRRQELHQPDHAEMEGAAGELVDLPADRDRRDLAGEARKAARQQEEQERSVPEQIAPAPTGMSRTWRKAVAERAARLSTDRPRNTALRCRAPRHNRRGVLGDSCCNCNRRSACWRCWRSHGRSARTAARSRCGKWRSGLPPPLSPRWCCSSCRRWQGVRRHQRRRQHDLCGVPRRHLLRVRLSRRRRAAVRPQDAGRGFHPGVSGAADHPGHERSDDAAVLLARAAPGRARHGVAAGAHARRRRRGGAVHRRKHLSRHGRGAAVHPPLSRAAHPQRIVSGDDRRHGRASPAPCWCSTRPSSRR